ncbi:MAG TPA: single-stranded DNA-binding protein [Clostridiales bacterium]|nr:single-stranded DNA-binding protein [Clostridiales bacterium]
MNYEEMNNNRVMLTGKVAEEAKFSHEVFGEGFYEIKLEVPRLSAQTDLLPVTVSERLLSCHNASVGATLSVMGQFRSYNKVEQEHSRLMLTVFARDILEEEDEINPNVIELEGYICKPPLYRTTPFKREICDLLLAVNRAYNKSDYIPCIAWGRNARYVNGLSVGDRIAIQGRIQSREYQKTTEQGTQITKTAYEVSISRVTAVSAELPVREAN